jgi:hypothetical protein
MRRRGKSKMKASRGYLETAASLAILVPAVALGARDELEGAWLQLEADRTAVMLTEAGEAAIANYEPLRDDPDVRCMPPSLTNVIEIPDPPFEIRFHDDFVEINYEYMDVKRRVPLDSKLRPEDAPFTDANYPHLGRSVGRFEADILVIETADAEPGYLDTLRVTLPQSSEMRTEERYTAEGDRLHVTIKHTDPIFYKEPFVIGLEFLRVDLEILEFNCTVDAASYDERL